MAVSIKYKKFNEVIDEATIELGNQQFMSIKAIESISNFDEQDETQLNEIQLKVIDETVPNVVAHNMTREELKELINVLNHILAQVNKNSNITNSNTIKK